MQNAPKSFFSSNIFYNKLNTLFSGVTDPIGIACSGGSDSLALLYLMADWSQRAGRRLFVMTVDHALRPQSEEEAKSVLKKAGALNLEAVSLKWEGKKPKTGIQKRARTARYRLMSQALSARGGEALVLAHTEDDQIETGLMRLCSGLKWQGFAGMSVVSACPVWPEGHGISLYRPLLEIKREDLQTCLHQRGEVWIEDPSNRNPEFERVRWRQKLGRWREKGFPLERFSALMKKAQQVKRYEEANILFFLKQEAALLYRGSLPFTKMKKDVSSAQGVLSLAQKMPGKFSPEAQKHIKERNNISDKRENPEYHPGGYFSFSPVWLANMPFPVLKSILGALLCCASGQAEPPASRGVERLATCLLTNTDFKGATLGGARLSFWRGFWIVSRDAGPVLNPFLGASQAQSTPLIRKKMPLIRKKNPGSLVLQSDLLEPSSFEQIFLQQTPLKFKGRAEEPELQRGFGFPEATDQNTFRVSSVWDGRFYVEASLSDLEIGPLGELDQNIFTKKQKETFKSLPPVVRLVLPALWKQDRLVYVPHIGFSLNGGEVVPKHFRIYSYVRDRFINWIQLMRYRAEVS